MEQEIKFLRSLPEFYEDEETEGKVVFTWNPHQYSQKEGYITESFLVCSNYHPVYSPYRVVLPPETKLTPWHADINERGEVYKINCPGMGHIKAVKVGNE